MAQSEIRNQKSDLPARLRAGREARGLSRLAMARQIDCDPQTIYRWECGDRTPSLDTLRRVAAVLDTTVGALVGE